MSTTVTLNFPPTKAGLAQAHLEIDRLEKTLLLEWVERPEGTAATVITASASDPIIAVYKRSTAGGRSREVLELIGGGKENALTPAELGQKLAPDARGARLSKASTRAVLRNIQKLEGHLLDAGQISRRALLIDFDGYGQEQAGRYYVSEEDRRTLDASLGR